MSHYGRVSEADDLDRYYTPSWCVELLLEELDSDVWGPTVAEPCAGQGAIVDVLEKHGRYVIAGDIDPESPYPPCDATDPETLERYRHVDCVITNPPYSCDAGSAFDVLDNLLALKTPVVALLRLSYLEPCAARASMYRSAERKPDRVRVLPRVHFVRPDGAGEKRNPQTSCWMIWRPDGDRDTLLEWWMREDRERVEGQEALL